MIFDQTTLLAILLLYFTIVFYKYNLQVNLKMYFTTLVLQLNLKMYFTTLILQMNFITSFYNCHFTIVFLQLFCRQAELLSRSIRSYDMLIKESSKGPNRKHIATFIKIKQ